MNKCDLSNSLFAKSFYAFAGFARHYVIRLVGWEDSDMDFQIRGKIGCYLLPIRKKSFFRTAEFYWREQPELHVCERNSQAGTAVCIL